MIGVVAREPVAVAHFIEELARQAKSGVESPHADGWGAALFTNGHWLHLREQCALWNGAMDAVGSMRATLMLLHVRKASDPTTINLTKLHPFCWPGTGAGLMFCQNGTIRKHENIPCRLDRSAIDTEKYFDLVIQRFEKTGDMAQSVAAAAEEIERSNADTTSLNALLSDGRELVAFKGRILPQNKGYHTLFFREETGLAVVSTEPFKMPGTADWQLLEGAWRKRFVD